MHPRAAASFLPFFFSGTLGAGSELPTAAQGGHEKFGKDKGPCVKACCLDILTFSESKLDRLVFSIFVEVSIAPPTSPLPPDCKSDPTLTLQQIHLFLSLQLQPAAAAAVQTQILGVWSWLLGECSSALKILHSV